MPATSGTRASSQRQFEHLSRLRFAGEDIGQVWVTCHYDWQWSGRRARLKKQEVAGDQLRELMLGERLRAYLWTLLGSAEAFKAVGRFDERLPRLQDLDYFIRFVRGRRHDRRAAAARAALPLSQVGPGAGRRRDPPLQPADLREVPPELAGIRARLRLGRPLQRRDACRRRFAKNNDAT